uniref:Uncharacterized protein n=1 Tax=Romanomermis culicivorax TaxID=13658 RepID=A0A915I7L8_ROMCU
MRAFWSTDWAKKYPHLPWALLNELFEVEALTAADVVLSAPAVLQILGPNVARQALKFIANRTIRATLVDKILLDCESSSPAVDAICRTVEEFSHNVRPTAVFARSPTTMTTGAQTLAAIAQQQPVAKAFGEPLCAVNHDVRVIKASPFPTATVPRSPKIGILPEVHPCGGLGIDFPGEEPVLSDDDD